VAIERGAALVGLGLLGDPPKSVRGPQGAPEMKLPIAILCGAWVGLIAGYYSVLLFCLAFLGGNLVGLPAVFVGAPLGLLAGAIAGGWLWFRMHGRSSKRAITSKRAIPMLSHQLLRTEGILIVHPQAPLEAADFQGLAQEIDPYIEANGKLNGLMIDLAKLPRWKDFAVLVAHLRFVKDHHRRIEKVAVVTNSGVLAAASKIASHFVQADIRHFSESQSRKGAPMASRNRQMMQAGSVK
jgi:hypothetical protein